jgi:hypothetical protein
LGKKAAGADAELRVAVYVAIWVEKYNFFAS